MAGAGHLAPASAPWFHLRPRPCVLNTQHAHGRPGQRIMYVLNILHYQLCYTSGLHHNLTILLSASLSNLQRIRRNFSGEDVTASKALVCRTPQARHAPPTQDDGHPMPPVSPVCHRRPVIVVSTSSSFSARGREIDFSRFPTLLKKSRALFATRCDLMLRA